MQVDLAVKATFQEYCRTPPPTEPLNSICRRPDFRRLLKYCATVVEEEFSFLSWGLLIFQNFTFKLLSSSTYFTKVHRLRRRIRSPSASLYPSLEYNSYVRLVRSTEWMLLSTSLSISHPMDSLFIYTMPHVSFTTL